MSEPLTQLAVTTLEADEILKILDLIREMRPEFLDDSMLVTNLSIFIDDKKVLCSIQYLED